MSERKEVADFDSTRQTAARLYGHILTKGLQVGSVFGIAIFIPMAYAFNSNISRDTLHRISVYSTAGGITLSGALGIAKMAEMDREGMENRVYRLHYNESQRRMDRMNAVFGLFGAGALGLMAGPDPYSLIAGFSMGTAAAVVAHFLTARDTTDVGKIVHELKY